MNKEIKEKIRKCLYQRMDSFLVEGDKPRPIGQLNLDRHSFVDTTTAELLELLEAQKQEIIELLDILIFVLKEK
jgi:hypothetical protein